MRNVQINTMIDFDRIISVQPDLVIRLPRDGEYSEFLETYVADGCKDHGIRVSSDLVSCIEDNYSTRTLYTDLKGSKVPVKVMCMYNTCVPNSHNVNKGFPEGMNYKELVVGAVVQLAWLDSAPTVSLVIEVDERAHNFKGDRTFKALDANGNVQRCTHDQIIELSTVNGVKTLVDLLAIANKMTDSLRAIEQIAQGHKNKNLQRISELASTALAK